LFLEKVLSRYFGIVSWRMMQVDTRANVAESVISVRIKRKTLREGAHDEEDDSEATTHTEQVVPERI
jgi:hypothetical protein